MNKKFKNTTLDGLAGMVKRGFERVDKKLDKKVEKEDLKDLSSKLVTLEEFDAFKKRIDNFEEEFKDLKNKSLGNQDIMLKKLDVLLTEKTVREHQEKKEKKLWLIVIRALKDHKILTPEELKEIAQLEIF